MVPTEPILLGVLKSPVSACPPEYWSRLPVYAVAPYLWMLSTSLKRNADVFSAELELLPKVVSLQGYIEAWNGLPLGRYLFNSTVMASGQTAGVLITSVLGGYAFARLRFPGRNVIFLLILGTMMIPAQVTLVPSFLLMKWLGWINTYQGLIVPHVVMPFGVFLMRQFFMTVPYELEEAARLDGCSRWKVLLTIVLPLSGPALATLAIFTFMTAWHEFFWPLIVTNTESMKTVQVALAGLVASESIPWPTLMATAVIASLPTLAVYLALQRYFTTSIAMTGLKG
jgi:multiple sugar transport system permease protein